MTNVDLSYEDLATRDKVAIFRMLVSTDQEIHALLARDAIESTLVDRLAFWLRLRAALAGVKGMILGISGGVDSATVAALLERATPGANRYYFLPCQSVAEDAECARLVADTLGITLETADLGPLYEMACAALGTQPQDEAPLHQINLKAMLRAVFLNTSGIRHWMMVAGTGNRSEIEHAGYFALRGDGAVDCEVLGYLFKRQVVEVGRLLGLPRRILERPPTHGLVRRADGTTLTDEESMGISYADIETATRLFMEFGRDLDNLARAAIERHGDDAERILTVCRKLGTLSWQNRYKSEPMPVAGCPHKSVPLLDDYPRGFPVPGELARWTW